MSISRLAPAALSALALMAGQAAAEIIVTDAYFITSGAMAQSGAAFMVIENTGDAPEHLADVSSDIAMRVALHTHKAAADGMMQMLHVPEGFEIPPHSTLRFERGGNHVMFMGLTAAPAAGSTVTFTLHFDGAGDIEVEAPFGDPASSGAMRPMEHHAAPAHDHAAMPATGHDRGAMPAVDQSGLDDRGAITALLRAQFDRPEAQLRLPALVVHDDIAIGTWLQDGQGGRVLLHKTEGPWQAVLCGGAQLTDAHFLDSHAPLHGMHIAEMLTQAEASLGAADRALVDGFGDIVLFDAPLTN